MSADLRAPNAERQTPNAERQTPNAPFDLTEQLIFKSAHK
jgi:hypothetical protein